MAVRTASKNATSSLIRLAASLAKAQERGKVESAQAVLDRIEVSADIERLHDREIVIEAIEEAIQKGARTGELGAGKIFVYDLAECVRIRTGERGPEAIG